MKKVIIMGGGPAGISAALKFAENGGFEVIVFEAENNLGGISKTLEYKGNKIDIGPHRFFSKSDEVVECWKKNDDTLLTKDRCTRIYFLNKFFSYPIKLSAQTLMNLGLIRTLKIGFSYIKSSLLPIKEEKNLEDFFINRFGKELYLTFFKDYTEKVWGISCREIPADWGAQRIKELSIIKTIIHALKSSLNLFKRFDKNVETSLTEFFYYPELGAGEMWEKMAQKATQKGVKFLTGKKIISLKQNGEKIEQIEILDTKTGEITTQSADYFISSIPIKDLIQGMNDVPQNVSEVADNLVYRDLVLLGMLFKKFKKTVLPDNWIYLQDRDIVAGRMEIYNNFSDKMLKDKNTVWLGLEYFCNKDDYMWSDTDENLLEKGKGELVKMNLFNSEDYIDGFVFRLEKAYPAYFGSYDRFDEVKKFTDTLGNLFLVGRNGMHRYNNMDHSMLTGMSAADNIINNIQTKDNIWDINTEDTYHEKK